MLTGDNIVQIVTVLANAIILAIGLFLKEHADNNKIAGVKKHTTDSVDAVQEKLENGIKSTLIDNNQRIADAQGSINELKDEVISIKATAKNGGC